jgi:hypothetical protein
LPPHDRFRGVQNSFWFDDSFPSQVDLSYYSTRWL